MTPRRKVSPQPLERSTSSRPISPSVAEPRSAYANVLARARALGLFAVVAIAPLGAMAGTVVACGGARPAQPNTVSGPPGFLPPVQTIEPPASAAPSSAPPVAEETE